MKNFVIYSLILMFVFFSCGKKESSDKKNELKKDIQIADKVTPEDFIQAVKDGNLKLVQDMLVKDASFVKTTDGNNETALNISASEGNRDICESLIQRGADVNFKDSDGNTPLHDAAKTNRRDVIDLLLNSNADINAKNNSGESIVYYAASNDNTELVQYLILKGADKNAPDNKGKTPMDIATEKKYERTIEALK